MIDIACEWCTYLAKSLYNALELQVAGNIGVVTEGTILLIISSDLKKKICTRQSSANTSTFMLE